MNIGEIHEDEREALNIWVNSSRPLSSEQEILCVTLVRLDGNAMPDDLANYCGTTVAKLHELRNGLFGILVDGTTGRFWVK